MNIIIMITVRQTIISFILHRKHSLDKTVSASLPRKQLIDSICAALNVLDKIGNVNISQLSL